jgi:hypothetical protein
MAEASLLHATVNLELAIYKLFIKSGWGLQSPTNPIRHLNTWKQDQGQREN